MALADIQEKQSEERKREKRLVHFTNAETRAFLESSFFKSKTKTQKEFAEYIMKSFLDYLFFEQHKEIRELASNHIQHFLVDFAPQKLSFTVTTAKKVPVILSDILAFLDEQGHIKNSRFLVDAVKDHGSTFQKAVSRVKKRSSKKDTEEKPGKKPTKKSPGQDIGRNDPCPCGSGKKYKKCCGRST